MTKCITANSRSGNSSSDPREEMLGALVCLPFSTYHIAIYLLLQRLGYRSVRFLNRVYLRGRTDGLSGDFEVCWPTPFGLTRIFVVVKQERRQLQRRYVDEIRGKMLRAGFSEGLVITTGSVSGAAVAAANEFPALPVTLVSGRGLAMLMIEKGLGVKPGSAVQVEPEFFRRLLGVRFASAMAVPR